MNYPLQLPLATHRSALMGVAMLMVLVYHYGIWVANYLSIGNVGYVGVDLFLLLSAYGLTCSRSQEVAATWRVYVRRRFVRLWPLFALTTLCTTLIGWGMAATQVPLWPQLCTTLALRLTTLAYYLPQWATPTDWYLNALPLFYLLLPVAYPWVQRRPWALLAAVSLCVSLVLVGYACIAAEPMHWRYECALARVPIFVWGMVLAMRRCDARCYWGVAAALAVVVAPVLFGYTRFLSHSLCVPLCLPALLWGVERLPRWGYRALAVLGHYTLPCYCANLVIEALMPAVDGMGQRTLLYVGGQVLLTLVFIRLSQLKRVVSK